MNWKKTAEEKKAGAFVEHVSMLFHLTNPSFQSKQQNGAKFDGNLCNAARYLSKSKRCQDAPAKSCWISLYTST